MKINFATCFDINYLSRGLVLYHTIKTHHRDFALYVLCLDNEVYERLSTMKLSSVNLIQVSEIEQQYPELLSVKTERSKIAYIFTLSPFYPSYILKNNPALPFICTLDADQYFWGSCAEIFRRLESCSVLIMPHRFERRLKSHEKYGKYNVSFQVFKNDKVGNECLAYWRNQCLEWCKDVLEDGKFAEQKYLDVWNERFGGAVGEIDHIGVGLAPWNLNSYRLSKVNGKVFVNEKPLILYHYQGLRIVNKRIVNSGLDICMGDYPAGFPGLVLLPIIRLLLFFSTDEVHDRNIGRNRLGRSKFNAFSIDRLGMFLLVGKTLFSLDIVLRWRNIFKRLYGKVN